MKFIDKFLHTPPFQVFDRDLFTLLFTLILNLNTSKLHASNW